MDGSGLSVAGRRRGAARRELLAAGARVYFYTSMSILSPSSSVRATIEGLKVDLMWGEIDQMGK